MSNKITIGSKRDIFKDILFVILFSITEIATSFFLGPIWRHFTHRWEVCRVGSVVFKVLSSIVFVNLL